MLRAWLASTLVLASLGTAFAQNTTPIPSSAVTDNVLVGSIWTTKSSVPFLVDCLTQDGEGAWAYGTSMRNGSGTWRAHAGVAFAGQARGELEWSILGSPMSDPGRHVWSLPPGSERRVFFGSITWGSADGGLKRAQIAIATFGWELHDCAVTIDGQPADVSTGRSTYVDLAAPDANLAAVWMNDGSGMAVDARASRPDTFPTSGGTVIGGCFSTQLLLGWKPASAPVPGHVPSEVFHCSGFAADQVSALQILPGSYPQVQASVPPLLVWFDLGSSVPAPPA